MGTQASIQQQGIRRAAQLEALKVLRRECAVACFQCLRGFERTNSICLSNPLNPNERVLEARYVCFDLGTPYRDSGLVSPEGFFIVSDEEKAILDKVYKDELARLEGELERLEALEAQAA